MSTYSTPVAVMPNYFLTDSVSCLIRKRSQLRTKQVVFAQESRLSAWGLERFRAVDEILQSYWVSQSLRIQLLDLSIPFESEAFHLGTRARHVSHRRTKAPALFLTDRHWLHPSIRIRRFSRTMTWGLPPSFRSARPTAYHALTVTHALNLPRVAQASVS